MDATRNHNTDNSTQGKSMSDRSVDASNGATWQSLDQLADGVQDKGEFSNGNGSAPLIDSSVSRRGFMTIMSASMALTAAACRRPIQKLVPAVKSHQTAIPGMAIDYTSVYAHRNVAYGALVISREGRPIRVRGNEKHDSNMGTASVEMQGSLLSLYDPERLRRPRVRRGGGATSYDNAVTKIADAVREAEAAGKRAVIVVNEHCSPSFGAMLDQMVAANEALSVVMMPSIVTDSPAMANNAMLGIDGEIVPDLDKAKVIVCVDADPLGADKLSLYHTPRYAKHRRPDSKNPHMSTLIVAESGYSLTGSNSDVRNKVAPSQVEPYLAVIEQVVAGANAVGGSLASKATAETKEQATQAAHALESAMGESVVIAGRHLSPMANAIALNINSILGSVGAGKPVDPSHVVPNSGAKGESIDMLRSDLENENVHALIFCDVNPEYASDRDFRLAMVNAPVRAAINLYEDETAKTCDISIPGSHWLESWGDAVAVNGAMSVRQPLIAPLNDGIGSTEDTLLSVAKKLDVASLAGYEYYFDFVKERWASQGDWRQILLDGVVMPAGSGTTADDGGAQTGSSASVNAAGAAGLMASDMEDGTYVFVAPSNTLYDGYYANNGWLLELSDPVTKITWENVALVSPKTAMDMGLVSSLSPKSLAKSNGQYITVSTESGTLDLPIWVQPGMVDNVIGVSLGWGHTAAGDVANGKGENAYVLSSGNASTGYIKAENVVVSDKPATRIASTQDHHTLDDGNGERPVAKEVTMGEIKDGHMHLQEHFPGQGEDGQFTEPLSIVPKYEYKGHRWGMVIDMSACTGCSSCVIACQNENNIPVVGKEQVLTGREMAWIRIDRYYRGEMDDPTTVVEPMLCQHCENAPCENVCPVAATTHSPEGLNEMTYNRCVGTRYCLNNCPYKVRRFNFLAYNEGQESPLDLLFNPDVTKRFRGVMEKCTFCVQRLNTAKWAAKDAGRARVEDGEAVTACQEACPAGAIIFGDTNDPESRVSKARYNERGFRVLEEINVRPQVTYLAKVRNAEKSTAESGHGEH